MRKRDGRGAEAFDEYYADLYGERWPALKAALLAPNAPVPFDGSGILRAPYFMDAASVLAARSLPLGGAVRMLDLCAAPGGKTLVIASSMDREASLVSNERSADRRGRLRRVLDEHLPPELRARVSVAGRDGAAWSRIERDAYDRILLDAPCSSERHVLGSPPHLAAWSPARVRALAQGEWALLSGAFLVLAPGGRLLYATCALSPRENDEVVGRLLEKYGSSAEIVADPPASFPDLPAPLIPEPTAFGFQVLPDESGGAGPLYFSQIRKKC